MSLIRGMRSMSYGYIRDFTAVPDSEENLTTQLVLETDDDDHQVKLTNMWPDWIALNASMIPTEITHPTIAERIHDGVSLGKNAIYRSPLIHNLSNLTNPKSFCSKLILQFENFGEYFLGNKKNTFINQVFDNFKLKFATDDTVLFEKIFLFSMQDSIVERYATKMASFLTLEGSSTERAPCKIYPYGGFYEYGSHPKQIESCIFQINAGNSTSAIKISTLTTLMKNGIDSTKNILMRDGTPFVGITDFTKSQTMNLYDELKMGFAQVQLMNLATNETCTYKSNGCMHVANTNLISISFIRKETT